MAITTPYWRHRFRKTGSAIDLGCGKSPAPGCLGIDVQDFGQDLVWDIREGLPFPDNSIEEVHTSHFVEHLTDAEACQLFEEILRVCKPGAVIRLRCPHENSEEAFYHNHLSRWSVHRLQGMIKGFNGAKYWRKSLLMVSGVKAGMELMAVLKVVKA